MPELQRVQPNLNAFTVEFDQTLLDELKFLYHTYLASFLEDKTNSHLFKGGFRVSQTLNVGQYNFYIVSYQQFPLLWVSNDCHNTYQVFKRFFSGLKIENQLKELIDIEKEVVMYCGFFVIGNHLNEIAWHVDYFDGANAFTLITPLFELDKKHGNLLYRDENKCINEYSYRLGEAIIFGDKFSHTTEPYPQTENLRVLLSLTFGTDNLSYWNTLKRTIGEQSRFMILPCGHQSGTCDCLNTVIGRNDPCFCSSGKKYKKCHGPLLNKA